MYEYIWLYKFNQLIRIIIIVKLKRQNIIQIQLVHFIHEKCNNIIYYAGESFSAQY